jgi:hypothetical protein
MVRERSRGLEACLRCLSGPGLTHVGRLHAEHSIIILPQQLLGIPCGLLRARMIDYPRAKQAGRLACAPARRRRMEPIEDARHLSVR